RDEWVQMERVYVGVVDDKRADVGGELAPCRVVAVAVRARRLPSQCDRIAGHMSRTVSVRSGEPDEGPVLTSKLNKAAHPGRTDRKLSTVAPEPRRQPGQRRPRNEDAFEALRLRGRESARVERYLVRASGERL